MQFSYDEVRAAVLRYMKNNQSGEVPHGFNVFHHEKEQGRHPEPEDFEAARETFHDFYREGVINSGERISSNQSMKWPFFRVTSYGRKVLASTEYEPHDAGGYLARLKTAIPAIDKDILRYLEESLACFHRGTLLASAVMLGCAAEKAALLLIEGFGAAIQNPNDQAKYLKETDAWMISKKYAALWKRLEPLSKSLPSGLGDDLHTILDRIFDLIRTTRNAAGHPTGKTIEREVMHANLLLFPTYCRRVYGLIDHFAANPV